MIAWQKARELTAEIYRVSAQGKAKKKLGSTPKITFQEMVTEMVREDLKSAERDELVKRHGYAAFNPHQL